MFEYFLGFTLKGLNESVSEGVAKTFFVPAILGHKASFKENFKKIYCDKHQKLISHFLV